MFKLKKFKAYELVTEAHYKRHGDKSIEEFDQELLLFMDELHEYLTDYYEGQKVSIVVNNWKWGGLFKNRGLRDPSYYGSIEKFEKSRSQHKYGKALDFDVYVDSVLIPADFIRELIIDARNEDWCQCIRFIEDSTNWVHVDVRPTEFGDLLLWDVDTGETKVYSRE